MSATVGYARVSTTDQKLDIQVAALQGAGCTKVFRDQRTGTTQEGRVGLDAALDYVREGDTLVVTRVDRLARSIGDLQDIVRRLRSKGVALRATEQPIDTSSAAGKAFLDMLGVFAEFETNLRRERQIEGIARAKSQGVYKGRPASIVPEAIVALRSEGLGPSEIARKLGIGRASVYRLLGKQSD